MPQAQLKIFAIRTDIFGDKDDLLSFVIQNVPQEYFAEKTILAITSKLVSLSEGRVVSRDQKKLDLIMSEADVYVGPIAHGSHLTIKQGLLMASAGIDESNSQSEGYILFPKDPYKSAHILCEQIKKKYSLKEFGIIFTDSRTAPLRIGVTGVALSHAGFEAINDKRGQNDLYGRALVMTRVHALDAMSGAAVLMMGEADEQTPLAVIQGAPVLFTDKAQKVSDVAVDLDEDLYAPMIKAFMKSY